MAMFDFRRGVGYPILKYDYNGSKYLEHVRYIHKHIYITEIYIYILLIFGTSLRMGYMYILYTPKIGNIVIT